MRSRQKIACLKKGKKIAHLKPVEVSKGATARGRRRSWEARWLTELSEVTHAPEWRANGVGLLACPVDKRLQAPKEFSRTMWDPLDVMSTRPIS